MRKIRVVRAAGARYAVAVNDTLHPYTTAWSTLADEIDWFREEVRDLPVAPQVAADEIRSELRSRFSFDRPMPLDRLVSEVSAILRKWTLHVTHPRYFGLFNPSVRPAGIAADALAALYNPQLAVWSHAPAAVEIEQMTLREFTEAIGFDPDSSIANFTSGGAEANLSAVLAAIARAVPDVSRSGLVGRRERPLIYITPESHHSFVKIARMTGLGVDALIEPESLERRIEIDRADGQLPMMVVGTAGTTAAGTVEPLSYLAEVAERHGLWFHVDAAWGGSALLSPRLRSVLRGIERADSVTWDAHKGLSVPMGAGMFFCRHPEAVRRAFSVSTSYMPESTEDTLDPYQVTPQWSRRMIGLKVFMSLAELGRTGYARMVERQANLAEELRRRLVQAGWVIKNETPLPVVCFTRREIECGSITTEHMVKTMNARGRVWISDVVLGGRERVLRACITSYRCDRSDIDCLIDELDHARRTHDER